MSIASIMKCKLKWTKTLKATFFQLHQPPKYSGHFWKLHSIQSQHISNIHLHKCASKGQAPFHEIELPYLVLQESTKVDMESAIWNNGNKHICKKKKKELNYTDLACKQKRWPLDYFQARVWWVRNHQKIHLPAVMQT